MFTFLFENKFNQIGSPIKNDVSKIREKFKESSPNIISLEIFKGVILNHNKIINLIQEYDSKAYSIENFEKIIPLSSKLMISLEKQKFILKKDWLYLVQIISFLGQTLSLEYENINRKSESLKLLNGN